MGKAATALNPDSWAAARQGSVPGVPRKSFRMQGLPSRIARPTGPVPNAEGPLSTRMRSR